MNEFVFREEKDKIKFVGDFESLYQSENDLLTSYKNHRR